MIPSFGPNSANSWTLNDGGVLGGSAREQVANCVTLAVLLCSSVSAPQGFNSVGKCSMFVVCPGINALCTCALVRNNCLSSQFLFATSCFHLHRYVHGRANTRFPVLYVHVADHDKLD